MPISVQRTQTEGVAPLPGVRVDVDNPPLEAFGGGAANRRIDLSGVQQQAQSIFEEAKRHADEVTQTNVGAQLSDLETKLSLATKARMGQNAFSAPEDVQKEWGDATQQIQKTLTNDDQRLMFGRMEAMHWASLNANVQNHVAQQRTAYDGQVTDSYVANERNAGLAGLASGDPSRLALAIDNQRIAVAKHLDRLGAPKEQADQVLAAVASDTHVAAVTQLLDAGQDLIAQQYFNAHKTEISGTQLGPLEKQLEAGSVLGEGQRRSDTIVKDAPTLLDGLNQARDIQDPKVRSETERLIRQHFEDVASSNYQQRVQANIRSTQVVNETHDVTKIPRADWDQLTETEQASLTHKMDVLRHPEKYQPNDDGLYIHLKNLASLSEATRAQFMRTDFTDPKYRSSLDSAHLDHLMDLQYTLRSAVLRHDDAADAAQGKSEVRAEAALQKKEETGIIKQSKLLQQWQRQQNVIAGNAELAATLSKFAGPKPKVDVPQWMIDSAHTTPGYGNYLRSMGVPIPAEAKKNPQPLPSPSNRPAPPRVPGGPILPLTPLNPPKGGQ